MQFRMAGLTQPSDIQWFGVIGVMCMNFFYRVTFLAGLNFEFFPLLGKPYLFSRNKLCPSPQLIPLLIQALVFVAFFTMRFLIIGSMLTTGIVVAPNTTWVRGPVISLVLPTKFRIVPLACHAASLPTKVDKKI